ncbi:aminopeptidase C [Alicyclobacillus sp. ALC3]|uniref:aminopeptidase C n=1 Tax=Alicyclobacillus sp. ALC3 TaxID=2796143 RepID=UPI00237915A7|nr:C1 family peptidase [Alicyclobacillus sp. ALC3]
MAISSSSINTGTISAAFLEEVSSAFRESSINRARMNAITKSGIEGVATNRDALVQMQFTFSNEIETGPITDQKQSGRCWLFAGLNTLRTEIARTNHVKPFELSQTYLMFWDKFEKANYFLERVIDTKDEATDSRIVQWLLQAPLQDGGQWDMFVNLVEKYGVVPQWVMPETYHSGRSRQMNELLTLKLRQAAAHLRDKHNTGAAQDDLQSYKQSVLADFYRMLCYFLGEPPKSFDFEYRDIDGIFHRDTELTPHAFVQNYAKVNLTDYVSVINAPTADKPFGRTYTVQYLGNVEGGRPVLYLNVDIIAFKQLALAQLLEGEPVWFGCDVGQMRSRDDGILDTDLYDYENAIDASLQMTKAQRLDYGESLMTHAMVLTGVNLADGAPNRWKVENSWGSKLGKDGFFVMSDRWFDEFMYQIVVHRKHLPENLLTALEQEPKKLNPWDPMGSLA